jgi:hypothetical protein
MALTFRARRSLINAALRSLRDPRQLAALLVVVGYVAINVGIILALLIFPTPPPLQEFIGRLVPGGVAAQLNGVRGTLTIILLSLAASSAFENPLLQFGQSDIDLVFPTPISSQRLLIGRLLSNHLRAFAAAYFFWGLTIAPLLRLSGFAIWPSGAWALLALTCAFASIDQLSASGLLWLSKRGADRWLMRGGLLLVGGLLLALAAALAARAITGDWGMLVALLNVVSSVLGTLILPVGLAVDVITFPAHPRGSWPWQAAVLVGFDLLSAIAVVAIGQGHVRELAVSPLGEGSIVPRALRRSGLNPARFAKLVWNPELIADQEQLVSGGVRPFGRGAWAMTWARLTQMRRGLTRTLLALGVLGLVPLAIVVQNGSYSMSSVLTAIIFSASLATQVFIELRDHLTAADTDLSFPTPRWQLPIASLAAHLPLYWAGGLILLVGVGVARGSFGWDLVGLALWYPLVVIPLIGFRGAVMFLFPAAVLPGRRDPVQYMVIALVNGVMTMALLALSLLPVGVMFALSTMMLINMGIVWLILYVCGGTLSALAILALAVAYQRFEPGEGT